MMRSSIVRLQGNGDYWGAKAFSNKWGALDAKAQQVIATMAHLPTDIRPVYKDKL